MGNKHRSGPALVGVVAIVAIGAAVVVTSGDDTKSVAAGSTESTGASGATDPAVKKDAVPVLTAGKVTKIEVSKGDMVRFQGLSDEAADEQVGELTVIP